MVDACTPATEPLRSSGRTLRYEISAVALLSLGFALVGLDLLIGRRSDRIGRRRILTPALLVFSLMSCFSGLALGLVTPLVARGIMGAEGAFLPACTAATAEASPEQRRGFNQGIELCTFAFVGLGFGPLIAHGLLQLTASWRWVFCLVAIPGLLVALGMTWVIREPPHLQAGDPPRVPVRWRVLFKSHNVPVAMALILCAMSCVFVLAGLLPSYLGDFVHLPAVSASSHSRRYRTIGDAGPRRCCALPARGARSACWPWRPVRSPPKPCRRG